MLDVGVLDGHHGALLDDLRALVDDLPVNPFAELYVHEGLTLYVEADSVEDLAWLLEGRGVPALREALLAHTGFDPDAWWHQLSFDALSPDDEAVRTVAAHEGATPEVPRDAGEEQGEQGAWSPPPSFWTRGAR